MIQPRPFPLIPRCLLLSIAFSLSAAFARAELKAGVGTGNVTPPIGTPSAGYGGRKGKPMTGIHDPLLATALAIDNGEKFVIFCGVDHLGMTSDMIKEIKDGAHADPAIARAELFVGSSHTHAGGGAFLNYPGFGAILAGPYDPAARQVYIDGSIKAIVAAGKNLQPAKIGIGYGHAPGLNGYRASWPRNIEPVDDVAVIKATKSDGSPLAVLFNFAAHPTVLSDDNMSFSADFVGYARDYAVKSIGAGVQPIYFNGAQADVSPHPPAAQGDRFAHADAMGKALAEIVKQIWDATTAADTIKIATLNESYMQEPLGNSSNMKISKDPHPTELNGIVFNDKQAFITIPGEISCIYDRDLKRFAGWLGFEHLSFLGLTNDAQGYIIIPEAWRHKTYESTLSFGGQMYGELVKNKIEGILHLMEPAGAPHEKDAHKPVGLSSDLQDGKHQ